MKTIHLSSILILIGMILVGYAHAEKLIWMREGEEEEVRGQLHDLQMKKKYLETEVDRLGKAVDNLEKENFKLRTRNSALESQLSVLTRSTMRIWTARNGKKLLAKLGEVDSKFVELEKKDGETVVLKRKQLSVDDNKYLDILLGKGDFEKPDDDAADPFDRVISQGHGFGDDNE